MSKSVKIVLDSAGIQEMLKSVSIASICEYQAHRLTMASGVEYRADVYIGKTRVNAKAGTTKEVAKEIK